MTAQFNNVVLIGRNSNGVTRKVAFYQKNLNFRSIRLLGMRDL